jgi:hypothetical protein
MNDNSLFEKFIFCCVNQKTGFATSLVSTLRALAEKMPPSFIKKMIEGHPYFSQFRSINRGDPVSALKNSRLFVEFYASYLLGDLLTPTAWDQKYPLQECEKWATNYLVKQKDFIETHSYGKDQIQYGSYLHQTVLIGKELNLKCHIEQLMSFLMLRRGKIAEILNQGLPDKFGVPLESVGNPSTVTECHKKSYDELNQSLRELKPSQNVLSVDLDETTGFQLLATLPNGEKANHSLIVLEEDRVIILHTSSLEERRQILEQVYTLCSQHKDITRHLSKLALLEKIDYF